MSFCTPNKIVQKCFAKFSKHCLYLQFELFLSSYAVHITLDRLHWMPINQQFCQLAKNQKKDIGNFGNLDNFSIISTSKWRFHVIQIAIASLILCYPTLQYIVEGHTHIKLWLLPMKLFLSSMNLSKRTSCYVFIEIATMCMHCSSICSCTQKSCNCRLEYVWTSEEEEGAGKIQEKLRLGAGLTSDNPTSLPHCPSKTTKSSDVKWSRFCTYILVGAISAVCTACACRLTHIHVGDHD
jgi:hypothetical protein